MERVIKLTGPTLITSQLKSISVSPDPPVPGKNLTVTVEADVQKKIEVGDAWNIAIETGAYDRTAHRPTLR